MPVLLGHRERMRVILIELITDEDKLVIKIWLQSMTGGSASGGAQKLDWEALTAFLLLLLPNLDTLDLPVSDQKPRDLQHFMWDSRTNRLPMYFIPGVFARAALSQRTGVLSRGDLRSLHTITAGRVGSVDAQALTFQLTEPILNLKSLVTFTGHQICSPRHGLDFLHPFHVKNLILTKTSMQLPFLPKYLRNVPYLKNFHYDYCGAETHQSLYITVYFPEYLAGVKDHLEELVMRNQNEVYRYLAANQGETSTMKFSVREFRRLRKLEGTIYMLMSFAKGVADDSKPELGPAWTDEQYLEFVQGLPPSLEEITITNCFKSTYNVLDVILLRSRDAVDPLRKLKSVHLEFWRLEMGVPDLISWDWHCYMDEFEKEGVKLTRAWRAMAVEDCNPGVQ